VLWRTVTKSFYDEPRQSASQISRLVAISLWSIRARCRAIDEQLSGWKGKSGPCTDPQRAGRAGPRRAGPGRALSLRLYITAPSEHIDSATLLCQYRPSERLSSTAVQTSRRNLWTWLTGRTWRPLQSDRRRRHCGYRRSTGRARGPPPGPRWSAAGRRKEWITTLCPVVRPHLNEQFDGERRVAVTTSLERNTWLTTSVKHRLVRRPLTELRCH